MIPEQQIAAMFEILSSSWGRQHWWPAQSRFEVIVGAFLTQNTNWVNVELALKKLRAARVLSVAGIRDIPLHRLEELIRSSGYFRQKASRLKAFVRFLDQTYAGSLTRMFAQPTAELRVQLLSLIGIGPETADSILLYAGQHPVFMVDAYTTRIAVRHGLASDRCGYEKIRALFESSLGCVSPPQSAERTSRGGAAHRPSRMSVVACEPQSQVFKEMHALIVGVGKKHCLKSEPRCESCPLKPLLPGRVG